MYCKLSSVLCLFLFADVSFASRTDLGQGAWIAISTEKACELNGEGITKVGTRGFVPNLLSCRRACLLHGTCIAVDFYADSNVCHFYESSCISPLGKRDGSSSHHLSRSAEFKAIDYGAACEANDEGIVPITNSSLQAISTLENCQDACLHRANCRAVDYYRHTGFCSFYTAPCILPKAKHDGASSYKIVRQLEERTIEDVKRDLVNKAKAKKAWHVISTSQSCERNEEGIVPIKGASKTVKSLQGCQNLCALHDTCAAIDYYRATQWCIFYAEPCMRPLAIHNNPASLTFKVEEPQWVTIDSQKACENSIEGVKKLPTVAGRVEASLEHCQLACLQRLSCMAVDYYRDTSWCNFYGEACSAPLSTSDGASSYRLVRKAGPGRPATPASAKIGDSMVAKASSVVTTVVEKSSTNGAKTAGSESHEHRWLDLDFLTANLPDFLKLPDLHSKEM